MSRHPELFLDPVKLSLVNDASGGIWGAARDRISWDHRVQYAGLKAGEFLQFRARSGVWSDVPPTPLGVAGRRNRQQIEVRLANTSGQFSASHHWTYIHAYFQVGASRVALVNDTGNPGDRVTRDHRLKPTGLGGLPDSPESLKVQFLGTDGIWRDQQPEPIPGDNTLTIRTTATGERGGLWGKPDRFSFRYERVSPLVIRLANDTGQDSNDRVTSDDQLIISGLEAGAVAEYQWPDGSWHEKQPVFEPGANTAIVRQRASDGGLSPITEFRFTLKEEAIELQPLLAPGVQLVHDTGVAGDQVTTDDQLLVTGVATGGVAEYQWSDGSWHEKQPVFEFGVNTAIVRQRDPLGRISPAAEFEFEFVRSDAQRSLPVVLENNLAVKVVDQDGDRVAAAGLGPDGQPYATHLSINPSEERYFQYQFAADAPGFAWLPYQQKVDLSQFAGGRVWVRKITAAGLPLSAAKDFSYALVGGKPSPPSVTLANDTGRSQSDLITNDLSIVLADPGAPGRLAYRLNISQEILGSHPLFEESYGPNGESPAFWWDHTGQDWNPLADPERLIRDYYVQEGLHGVKLSVDFFRVSESGVPSDVSTLEALYAPVSPYVPHVSGEKAYMNGVPVEPTGLGVEIVFVKDDGYSKSDKVSSQIYAYLSGSIPSGGQIQHRLNGSDWSSVESWMLQSGENTAVAFTERSRIGRNKVEVRHVDAAGNVSDIYNYHYTYDPKAKEQVASDLLLANTQAYVNSFGGSAGLAADGFSGLGRDVVLSSRSRFKRKHADRITNFNSGDGAQLMLDRDWLPAAPHRLQDDLLRVVQRKGQQRKAAKTETPLIYNQAKGRLYLNGNGSEPGWGKLPEGGLIARFDAGLFLEEFDFGFL